MAVRDAQQAQTVQFNRQDAKYSKELAIFTL